MAFSICIWLWDGHIINFDFGRYIWYEMRKPYFLLTITSGCITLWLYHNQQTSDFKNLFLHQSNPPPSSLRSSYSSALTLFRFSLSLLSRMMTDWRSWVFSLEWACKTRRQFVQTWLTTQRKILYSSLRESGLIYPTKFPRFSTPRS